MRTIKLIPALDCAELGEAVDMARRVDDLPSVYGYKVGFSLGLTYGLPQVVRALRDVTPKPIIYDHQKAGTDIPDTGPLFAKTLANAGVDEAILFPQAGPETLAAWTAALHEEGLKVIVGGVMTHAKYLASEGGFLVDEGIYGAYQAAAKQGVKAFVVPMTKPDLARIVSDRLGPGDWEFYSPGFGKQGGAMAGFEFIHRHYVIVGRSLFGATDPAAYLSSVLKGATP